MPPNSNFGLPLSPQDYDPYDQRHDQGYGQQRPDPAPNTNYSQGPADTRHPYAEQKGQGARAWMNRHFHTKFKVRQQQPPPPPVPPARYQNTYQQYSYDQPRFYRYGPVHDQQQFEPYQQYQGYPQYQHDGYGSGYGGPRQFQQTYFQPAAVPTHYDALVAQMENEYYAHLGHTGRPFAHNIGTESYAQGIRHALTFMAQYGGQFNLYSAPAPERPYASAAYQTPQYSAMHQPGQYQSSEQFAPAQQRSGRVSPPPSPRVPAHNTSTDVYQPSGAPSQRRTERTQMAPSATDTSRVNTGNAFAAQKAEPRSRTLEIPKRGPSARPAALAETARLNASNALGKKAAAPLPSAPPSAPLPPLPALSRNRHEEPRLPVRKNTDGTDFDEIYDVTDDEAKKEYSPLTKPRKAPPVPSGSAASGQIAPAPSTLDDTKNARGDDDMFSSEYRRKRHPTVLDDSKFVFAPKNAVITPDRSLTDPDYEPYPQPKDTRMDATKDKADWSQPAITARTNSALAERTDDSYDNEMAEFGASLNNNGQLPKEITPDQSPALTNGIPLISRYPVPDHASSSTPVKLPYEDEDTPPASTAEKDSKAANPARVSYTPRSPVTLQPVKDVEEVEEVIDIEERSANAYGSLTPVPPLFAPKPKATFQALSKTDQLQEAASAALVAELTDAAKAAKAAKEAKAPEVPPATEQKAVRRQDSAISRTLVDQVRKTKNGTGQSAVLTNGSTSVKEGKKKIATVDDVDGYSSGDESEKEQRASKSRRVRIDEFTKSDKAPSDIGRNAANAANAKKSTIKNGPLKEAAFEEVSLDNILVEYTDVDDANLDDVSLNDAALEQAKVAFISALHEAESEFDAAFKVLTSRPRPVSSKVIQQSNSAILKNVLRVFSAEEGEDGLAETMGSRMVAQLINEPVSEHWSAKSKWKLLRHLIRTDKTPSGIESLVTLRDYITALEKQPKDKALTASLHAELAEILDVFKKRVPGDMEGMDAILMLENPSPSAYKLQDIKRSTDTFLIEAILGDIFKSNKIPEQQRNDFFNLTLQGQVNLIDDQVKEYAYLTTEDDLDTADLKVFAINTVQQSHLLLNRIARLRPDDVNPKHVVTISENLATLMRLNELIVGQHIADEGQLPDDEDIYDFSNAAHRTVFFNALDKMPPLKPANELEVDEALQYNLPSLMQEFIEKAPKSKSDPFSYLKEKLSLWLPETRRTVLQDN